ncbi:pectinesterase-like [Cucurbita pepo subsp. pepo]|uniref:pectinesterase-like n=1 Tax=Cucurbita pepo subsp. pepo TaxID=3664 RepID=UPI000C9D4756|nr:pectinesterase-like [Cucurbita pepo subsp. pepo]
MAQTDDSTVAGAPSTGSPTSISNKKHNLFILALSAAVLLAGVSSDDHVTAVRSTCAVTLYPELCQSTISTAVETSSKKVSSSKDIIEASVNITISAVKQNYKSIKKLLETTKHLTKREKIALHDCLETGEETLRELYEVVEDLNEYPKKKSLPQYADDLKTLLSSAITNQETCVDGFSHDRADKKIRESLLAGQIHVEKLCSVALALIKNLTDTDIANHYNIRGRSMAMSEFNWPDWMSPGDRRLLQASSTATPDVVVAADGSGDFQTVSAAVAAAPSRSSRRYIIRIKAGVYRENVNVPSSKTNIMFWGDGRTTTIITGNRNVVDGSTTFNSATVAAVGGRFLARDITFQNTAGPSKHQAVALRVGSDLSAFYRCDMLAYQDTLYVHSNRQFYVSCIIVGTVDFIFGNAAAVIQNSDIHARRPNPGQKNMVTAQGRTDPNQNTGIVIQKCRIGTTSDLQPVIRNFPTFLGRPWQRYSRTVVMQTSISNVIDPAGWHIWDGNFALDTLFYAEYQNSGAGADTSRRVTWKGYRVISSAADAESFTAGKFISGGTWLSSTGFPFSLGL